MKKYVVAVVGATGAVGDEMLNCTLKYLPWGEIKLLASAKSAGKVIEREGHSFTVEELTEDSFQGVDIALFSAGGSVSAKFAPIAVQSGAIAIDNTSHFRMTEGVPLVVPEVNGEALRNHKGLIANPNCSTIQMVSAMKRINDEFKIKRVVVATYQAVSGAGAMAMLQLTEQTQKILNGESFEPKILPCGADKKHYQIAFNPLAQIDVFEDNGYTKEEMKMVNETKKIFDQDIEVNATCVRVPVYRGHSESIYLETEKPLDMRRVFELLDNSVGIVLQDDIKNQIYPQAINCVGDPLTYVGRVRKDLYLDNAMSMWVVSDNLMKGAAYNSVDIANCMIQMGLI